MRKITHDKQRHMHLCGEGVAVLAALICFAGFAVPYFFATDPDGDRSATFCLCCMILAGVVALVGQFGKCLISSIVATIQTMLWVFIIAPIPCIFLHGFGGWVEHAMNRFGYLNYHHFRCLRRAKRDSE